MKKAFIFSLLPIFLLAVALTAVAADTDKGNALFTQDENTLSVKMDEKDMEALFSQDLPEDDTVYKAEITINDKVFSGTIRQAKREEMFMPEGVPLGGPDGKAPDGKAPMGMPPEGAPQSGPNGKAPDRKAPDVKDPMMAPPPQGPQMQTFILEFKADEKDETPQKYIVQIRPAMPEKGSAPEMPEPPAGKDHTRKHFKARWRVNGSEPSEAEVSEDLPKEK